LRRSPSGPSPSCSFPRFTGRYRTDKRPEDATTVDEIVEMYKSQLKVIALEEGEGGTA
jgi:DNA ligase-1